MTSNAHHNIPTRTSLLDSSRPAPVSRPHRTDRRLDNRGRQASMSTMQSESTALRQAPAFFLALLLFIGCSVPFPRSTYIQPGIHPELGVGAGALLGAAAIYDQQSMVVLGSARLGMNPSNRLGFDLGLNGMLIPQRPEFGFGGFSPTVSLTAKVRPIPQVNAMLFGEAGLSLPHAGIVLGVPLTGREVMTLGLTTGLTPRSRTTGVMNYDWLPMVLGSVSWHGRTTRLRVMPSLVGGYYGDSDLCRWLLAFTVSGVGREDDSDDE